MKHYIQPTSRFNYESPRTCYVPGIELSNTTREIVCALDSLMTCKMRRLEYILSLVPFGVGLFFILCLSNGII